MSAFAQYFLFALLIIIATPLIIRAVIIETRRFDKKLEEIEDPEKV
mgnify:CR=1 FL=1